MMHWCTTSQYLFHWHPISMAFSCTKKIFHKLLPITLIGLMLSSHKKCLFCNILTLGHDVVNSFHSCWIQIFAIFVNYKIMLWGCTWFCFLLVSNCLETIVIRTLFSFLSCCQNLVNMINGGDIALALRAWFTFIFPLPSSNMLT